ncbi:MAG: hypothetical protein V3W41_21610 [Planctomycetota bacterium]
MKIYFCDECNESIPLSDINSNKITIDQGKIFCNDCAPTPKTTSTSGLNVPTIGLGMLLCLGLGMGIMAVWGDTLLQRGDHKSTSSRVEALESQLGTLRESFANRLGAVEAEFDESTGREGKVGKYATATRAISENAEALRQVRHSLSQFGDELRSERKRETQTLEELGTRLENDIARLDQAFGENVVSDLQKISTDLDAIRDRQRHLDERMAYVEEVGSEILKAGSRRVEGSGSAANADKHVDTVLSDAQRKQLDQVLLEISSSQPAKRFAAVSWFSELEPAIRNRHAEEALVGTFGDKSDYVVTAALDSLAAMSAQWSIPSIIELLKHDNIFIREKAIDSLGKLTGSKVKLDAAADRGIILTKVRELQEWWRLNKGRLIGS